MTIFSKYLSLTILSACLDRNCKIFFFSFSFLHILRQNFIYIILGEKNYLKIDNFCTPGSHWPPDHLEYFHFGSTQVRPGDIRKSCSAGTAGVRLHARNVSVEHCKFYTMQGDAVKRTLVSGPLSNESLTFPGSVTAPQSQRCMIQQCKYNSCSGKNTTGPADGS